MKWLVAPLFLFLQASVPPAPSDAHKKLDYFVGKWRFEWTVPDSPLGRGGRMAGTETYRKILNGFFLESEIEGAGPLGPFQGRAFMGYNERDRVYTRYELDSLGLAMLKAGPMGSDAGGWSMIYWEATPVVRGGKVIRMKGATLMYSPVNYRLRLQISVDGGPYTSFGSPWFRKEAGSESR